MEVLERFLSNTSTVASVASKGNRSRCVCAGGCWGLAHPCCLGQFSCGNKKRTVRKRPVSVMQKKGEER